MIEKIFIVDEGDPRFGSYPLLSGHVKLAEVSRALSDDVRAFIDTLKPNGKYRYVLINALGAGEYYGPNSNGDFFPEKELVRHYKTFYNAHPFRYHINKDPAHSYGKVLLSSWNPRMKRVELVVAIDSERAPDIVEDIDSGRMPLWSMGSRVAYDICSACGNRARNRNEYCQCLKSRMLQFTDDGKQIFAINPNPQFFDISRVRKPADITAHTLKKIASSSAIPEKAFVATYLEEAMAPAYPEEWKDPYVEKFATVGLPILEAYDRQISKPDLDKLACFEIDDVVATTLGLGIVLKPQEYQYLALCKLGMSGLASNLLDAHAVIGFPDPEPTFKDALVLRGSVNEKLGGILSGYVSDRSLIPQIAIPRLEKIAVSDAEPNEHSKSVVDSPLNIMGPLAASYLMYRHLAGREGEKVIENSLLKTPLGKIILLGLGASAITGLQGVVSKLLGGVPEGNPMGEGSETSLPEKTASNAMSVIWPSVAIPYLWASYTRKREQKGEEPGPISKFVSEYPAVPAAGLVWAGFKTQPHLKKLIAFARKKMG